MQALSELVPRPHGHDNPSMIVGEHGERRWEACLKANILQLATDPYKKKKLATMHCLMILHLLIRNDRWKSNTSLMLPQQASNRLC